MKTLFLSLLAFFFSLCACAENRVTAGELDNGLRYVILTAPAEKGRVEIRLQVNAGASDQTDSQAGVAHMVEHMVFRAAPEYPQGVGASLMAQGFERGKNFNAMTSFERTLYLFSPPKGTAQLPAALNALTAMLKTPNFSESDWQEERQIILAEWRNGRGANERMNRQRTASIRSGSRQARGSVIGEEKDIREAKADTLREFHQQWYHPNNMQLLIAGDVNPAEIRPLLEETLGTLPSAPLPERGGSYYEPQLQSGWHTSQLQDKDSGGSHIALIFRLDDSPSRDYTNVAGRRERLLDRYAINILNERLKNQQDSLPEGVSNVSLRKADIGHHTTAVGLFATVYPQRHAAGLTALLRLSQQLLNEPVTQAEVDAYSQKLNGIVDAARQKTALPELFGDAIRTVSDSFFNNRPIRTQAENAALTAPIIPTIHAGGVQARIMQWLHADDKLVQYQGASLTPVSIASSTAIAAEAERIKHSSLPPLAKAKPVAEGSFRSQPQTGAVVSSREDSRHHVSYWQLSNGDTVVWLQTPAAGEKTYLESRSGSGFLSTGINPWQSQTAVQIAWQSAPQGFDRAQIQAWNKAHNVFLSQKLTESQWQISGNSSDIAALLQSYHAYQTTPQIGQGWRETIQQMMNVQAVRQHSDRAAKETAAAVLRYGSPAYRQPDAAELAQVSPASLLAQYRLIQSAPSVHYIVSSQSAAASKPLIQRYLASIPRQPPRPSQSYQALAGQAVQSVQIGIENRAEVSAWSWTDSAWQPAKAVQISLLANIAQSRLKAELRDKALGVYSLAFSAQLNPQDQRIESELKFNASAVQAQALWQQAEAVLQQLPDTLTQSEVDSGRAKFIAAERSRRLQPETLLHRLILSQENFGDARYLSSMDALEQAVALPQMREAAAELWKVDNCKVLIIEPQQN